MFDPAHDLRLDGLAALVTGGTRGIGRGIAEALASAGASVCVTARKAEELDETVSFLGSLGAGATSHQGSAGTPEDAEAGVARCLEAFGRCDVLINNAATNPQFGPLVEADPSAVRKTWQVNIEGPLYYAQAAWRGWMKDHGGAIVNVASVGGLRVSPFIGAYNISKAALMHMTRQLASEMAPGVRVNAVAPALVKTEFARALWEPDEEAAAARHPLRRLGTPDDIAGAVLFLASPAGSWMTGETIVLDGGALLH